MYFGEPFGGLIPGSQGAVLSVLLRTDAPLTGRQIHGRFPDAALGSADDIGSGRLLPANSVTQMAATLGRWMGLSTTEVATVLPGIGRFDAMALRFL